MLARTLSGCQVWRCVVHPMTQEEAMVPGAGIEPARLAAGDFEPSLFRYAGISQGTTQPFAVGSSEGAVASIIPWLRI
jgi:hypothetical protein